VIPSPFATVADRLDLVTASSGVQRNDLLPPRREDKVGGEVGNRFRETLARDLSSGAYEPDSAIFIPVPKQTLATRPAALLSLRDRVVYDALVSTLRPRIDKALVNPEVLFWPRGMPTPKRWREFDKAPTHAPGSTHIALLDISAFYESIDHERLAVTLVEATGRHANVAALTEFLGRVMRDRRGLPQGLAASDPLATIYLAPLDRAMLRLGHEYWRNGDDMRVAVSSYSRGVGAVALVEDNLRRLGLILNGSKSRIVRVETYLQQLRHIEGVKTNLRKSLENRRLTALEAAWLDHCLLRQALIRR